MEWRGFPAAWVGGALLALLAALLILRVPETAQPTPQDADPVPLMRKHHTLDAVTSRPEPEFLLPPVRANGPIVLAEPDPGWAGQYAREEARIRTALDPRSFQVEHVGSTSIPGLAANPFSTSCW